MSLVREVFDLSAGDEAEALAERAADTLSDAEDSCDSVRALASPFDLTNRDSECESENVSDSELLHSDLDEYYEEFVTQKTSHHRPASFESASCHTPPPKVNSRDFGIFQ